MKPEGVRLWCDCFPHIRLFKAHNGTWSESIACRSECVLGFQIKTELQKKPGVLNVSFS